MFNLAPEWTQLLTGSNKNRPAEEPECVSGKMGGERGGGVGEGKAEGPGTDKFLDCFP